MFLDSITLTSLIGMLMTGGGNSSNWSIANFLTNATSAIQNWGSLVIILIGVVMIIVAVYQIAKGLISHGKTQTNWAVAILLLLIGGVFMAGGFQFVANIAQGGKTTIEDLGAGGTILWTTFQNLIR